MNKNIKRIGATVVGLGVVAAVAYGAAVTYDLHRQDGITEAPDAQDATDAQIARGKYVAYAADCAACHTVSGQKPFSGGYALHTPFGEIQSSNITSDKETGIGNWTLSQFDRAVRHGKGSHGYLYPAMPYTAYTKMSDGDIRDLWAYMRTIPAVNRPVVENQLPFPFNQRWSLAAWNALYFHPGTFQPESGQSAEYNRGAYLVNGPGHCAACHTGKNFLGGDSPAFLQGGALQGWYAPDLTPNAHVGLGNWSVADLTSYLKTGSNDKTVSSGPMTEAVENSTQHLTDTDLNAIAVYLTSLPASTDNRTTPVAAAEKTMVLGKLVYESQCIACHVSNGQGIRRMIPALAGSPVVNANDPSTLLQMVLKGGNGPQTAGNPTGAGMPRFDWKLSNDDIAAALTYVRNAWGNAAPAVDEQAVATARSQLQAKAWSGK
ncbi:cytochrome c [Robbsia sp. KACC 23696]|uniref:cytochrome c n=1 Tax=Robbsia sp. KACC 23696 TaxID=3149231 RepID=UPI00325B601A